jgi:DNA-directed RNA polymerase specialized sigma24 family protein
MNRTDEFNTHRPLLFSIAYRMLGSRADAEDASGACRDDA